MRKSLVLNYCSMIAIAATVLPQAALAQASAPAADAEQGVGEIIVTARKTSENLQTTPVAVTAVSGEMLERAQVVDVSQVQQMVPNISFGQATAQPGSATIGLRGQSGTDGLLTVDNAIGLYLDGVYIARSAGALLNLVDVERVEVLRGPQGTLFGRNTTGGALNLVSKQPVGEFEGSIRARYGNYDAKELTTVLNVPLAGETLAARLVYQHSDRNGFAINSTDGNDVGSDNVDFMRGTLRFAPDTLPLTVTLAGDYTDRKTSGQIVDIYGARTNNPVSGAAFGAFLIPGRCATTPSPACFVSTGSTIQSYVGGNPFEVSLTPGLYGTAKTWGVSATSELEISDDIQFKSVTAWRDLETHSLSDNDGTPYVLSGGIPEIIVSLPGRSIGQGNHIWQKQFSQEVQLSGKALDNSLSWIVGAFYFTEEGEDLSLSSSNVPGATAAASVTGIFRGEVKNTSRAAFGQVSYELTDGLRFTTGLRYTKDKRSLISRNGRVADLGRGAFTCTVNSAAIADAANCISINQQATYDYWSYTFGPDWQVSQNLFLYGKVSRAYRAGGWNLRTLFPGSRNDFDPEKVTDYEIGAKIDLMDRKLRFNVAAFNTDYQNIQRSIQALVGTPPSLSNVTQNAASAKIKGIEVEVVAAPTSNLRLNASFGYTDAKHKTFVDQATPPNDLSATPFTLAPKETFSAGFDYTIPAGGSNEVILHGDIYHKGDQYGVAPPPFTGLTETARMDAYNLVNATVTLRLGERGIDVQAYVRNLFDKRYLNRNLNQEHSLGFTSGTPGDPRTYGISIGYKF
jgi:iron complex outermembrane receptor protein